MSVSSRDSHDKYPKKARKGVAHLNDSSLAYSKSFRRFHQQKAIKKKREIPRMDARTIVKIKKVGEAFTVEELGWTMPVLDALGLLVGEIAGETVDEKAPGSDAVVFTVDLWAQE